ncbi:MAG: hypothetical protein M9894_28780 [Planctomycetes bacterium]|nr:hypothetical protein [Planctomycetota bacterium]
MSPRARRLPALTLVLALAPGCISWASPADLAESTMPLQPGEYRVIGNPVTGTASSKLLFGVPLGDTNQAARTARQNALAQSSGADALVNVSMSYVTTIYFGFLTITRTWVRGEPVKVEPRAPAPADTARPPAPQGQ